MAKNSKNWTAEPLPPAYAQTRTAAAAWFYALQYEPHQDIPQLKPLLKECFPLADLDLAEAIVRRLSPYEDITDALVDEVLATAHVDNLESLPWREAVLRVLAIDFLAAVKGASAVQTEDALVRITSYLDDKLRGASKNACQFIAGQRTRIRKAVRLLVLAMLYVAQYRKSHTVEMLQADTMQLVIPWQSQDFIKDDFPFDDFIQNGNTINVRGRYAFCEATKVVRAMLNRRAEIDEIIQRSSKKWRVPRMSIIDLNILRLGTYELMFERISTPRVLINEAVELAKAFGAEQSKNFVNGILQQLCNDNHIEVV